jgi:hypothetical protein
MAELLVVLGAEVTLLLSIAAMNVYRWRTDVLAGPYVFKREQPPVAHDAEADPVAEAGKLAPAMPENEAMGPWPLQRPVRQEWNTQTREAPSPDIRKQETARYVPDASIDLAERRARLSAALSVIDELLHSDAALRPAAAGTISTGVNP